MVIVSLKKLFLTFGYAFFAVILAWVVLFVSLSRMSLTVLANQNGCELSKNRLIALTDTANGSAIDETYKLPEVTTLPNSPFYGLKIIRDYFWLTFSTNPAEKGKIVVFLADKKMAEMYELIKIQQNTAAIDAAEGALEKLNYGEKIIKEIKGNPEARVELRQNMTKAGLAYRHMAESLKTLFDLDQTKYSDLLKGLDDYNQKQATETKQISL